MNTVTDFPSYEPPLDMQSSELVGQDQKIFHVLEHVFLGTTWGSEDLDLIKQHDIKRILNAAANHPNHFSDQGLDYTLFDHPVPGPSQRS